MAARQLVFITLLALTNIAQTRAQGGSEYGQFAPPDAFADDPSFAFYGSENEWSRRMFSAENAEKDSKRMGQRLLLEVLDGNLNRAVELCEAQLVKDPNDLETLFVLA
jgi:hypothetical protein